MKLKQILRVLFVFFTVSCFVHTAEGQVNLQLSKPLTLGGVICATYQTQSSCSGYQLSAGDTVPAGKIWKVEFIGAGGSGVLCPKFSINGMELNGWDPNQNKLWGNLQPIWLNSGDYFTFEPRTCGNLNSAQLLYWTVNVLEFYTIAP